MLTLASDIATLTIRKRVCAPSPTGHCFSSLEGIKQVNEMRNILTMIFRALLLSIVSFGTLSSLSAQERSRDSPVRKETHRQYQLAPNTTVEISTIAGPVEIETISGQSAEINIVNSAPTQADLNCLDTPIEQTPRKLVMHSKSLCTISRVSQWVTLKLPRNVNLDLSQIAGHVSVIGPTEGTVHLESIAGHVSTGSLQSAEMSSLAEGLSMEIKQIGERGVRLSSVVGGIELALSDNLNAQFEASSIVGNVISDIPSVRLVTDRRSDFEARIGSGGPLITISSVRGGIRLRKLD
jgi:hypothetical protein